MRFCVQVWGSMFVSTLTNEMLANSRPITALCHLTTNFELVPNTSARPYCGGNKSMCIMQMQSAARYSCLGLGNTCLDRYDRVLFCRKRGEVFFNDFCAR